MKRTTVFIEERLLERARAVARHERKSFATVVREALAAYLNPGPRSASRLPSVAGEFASGHSDTSAHVDELLWQGPHGPAPPRPAPPPPEPHRPEPYRPEPHR